MGGLRSARLDRRRTDRDRTGSCALYQRIRADPGGQPKIGWPRAGVSRRNSGAPDRLGDVEDCAACAVPQGCQPGRRIAPAARRGPRCRPQYPSHASSGPFGKGTRNHFSNMKNRANGTKTDTPSALRMFSRPITSMKQNKRLRRHIDAEARHVDGAKGDAADERDEDKARDQHRQHAAERPQRRRTPRRQPCPRSALTRLTRLETPRITATRRGSSRAPGPSPSRQPDAQPHAVEDDDAHRRQAAAGRRRSPSSGSKPAAGRRRRRFLISCMAVNPSLVCEAGPDWAGGWTGARGPGAFAVLGALYLPGCQEARFLHQVVVELVVRGHPGLELVAGHEGLVEGAVLHELLPVVGGHHLLEQIDVEGDLLGLHAGRHEDAAQHLVLGVDARLPCRSGCRTRPWSAVTLLV